MISLKEALIGKHNADSSSPVYNGSQLDELQDPNAWNVGDYIYITYNYNACIPVFYKIEKKAGKATFYLREYGKKIVKGAYNSPAGYECIPDSMVPTNETKTVRMSKGVVRIDKHISTRWDGKPVHGYSD